MSKSLGYLGVSVVLIFSMSCGGSSDTGPSPTPQTCRTYATSSTTVTTVSTGGGNNRTLSCTFNSSNQLACTMTISVCGVVSFTVNYASKADFVDEVSVIPPRMLQLSQTTSPNSCNITNATYSYDGQKRLLNYTINGLTYSYSAWESGGRPTAGTVSGPGNSVVESWSYNDNARTATLVQSNAFGSTTTTYVYDANGNPGTVVVLSGGAVSTSVTSTTGTAQVCK